MTSIHDKIRQAASRNTHLLTVLSDTDGAPSKLYQQINYVNDLSEQLKKSQTHANKLKHVTRQELEAHKKYNESTFRRFAHKASGRAGKFEEKAAKEEKDYFDAIQAEKTAQDELAYVKQLLSEAQEKKTEYERDAASHDQAQRELDSLYDEIFRGETPGFPEEDARERACEEAKNSFGLESRRSEREKHVLFLLKQACGRLLDAKRLLMEADDLTVADMFGGFGASNFASMQKRNRLELAESAVQQARMQATQLGQVDPEREGEFNVLAANGVHVGNIWSEVVFDYYVDAEMHRRIERAEDQIDNALVKGAALMKEQKRRELDSMAGVQRLQNEMKEMRAELQRSREEAFRRVTGGEIVSASQTRVEIEDEAPPAYEA